MKSDLGVSVIVPVSERYDDVAELYRSYRSGLSRYADRCEFIYVLDGDFAGARDQLQKLQADGEPVTVLQFSKQFGEAAAYSAGFKQAAGATILILPAYHQVDPSEVYRLVEKVGEYDVVVARRNPRTDSRLHQLQTLVFNRLLKSITGEMYRDIGCSARALTREVADELTIYGDQHRFLPLLASRDGFKVVEVDLPQSGADRGRRFHGLVPFLHRALDLFTVFFLTRFTRKPLRFFGSVGVVLSGTGALILLYAVFERLVLQVGLGDRPVLLLSCLLIVLGVQIFALGIIGELIIFSYAHEKPDYRVEKEVVGGRQISGGGEAVSQD